VTSNTTQAAIAFLFDKYFVITYWKFYL